MGREYDASWSPDSGALILTALTVPERTPWRFAPDGADRWRGRAGAGDGEVLLVRRDAEGAVTGLDVAAMLLTRTPDGD